MNLASVQKIINIQPIEGADKIEVANQKDFIDTCLKLNIPHCPKYKEVELNHTLEEILKESEIKDVINPYVDAEGLVWRCVEDNLSFKVLNNKYLLKNDQ